MAALDLNSIRATIESRLVDELTKAPPLPVVFYNQPFSSKEKLCIIISSNLIFKF